MREGQPYFSTVLYQCQAVQQLQDQQGKHNGYTSFYDTTRKVQQQPLIPLYFVCPSHILSTSSLIYSSKPPGVQRGFYPSTAMAHLTMRLSGVCIHTEGAILITYYLTCNVFCPFFVCMSCFPPPTTTTTPSSTHYLNKWKNIHCPGLLLNFSLSASNLKRSCCDVTGASKQRERGKGRRPGGREKERRAGNLQTSKVTLLNPTAKNPITLYECFSQKSLMQPSICFEKNTNEVLSCTALSQLPSHTHLHTHTLPLGTTS